MLLQDWMIYSASLSTIVCFVKNSIKLQLICEKCFEAFHSTDHKKAETMGASCGSTYILLGLDMWWRWTFIQNKDDYERLNFSPAVAAKWCQSCTSLKTHFSAELPTTSMCHNKTS